MCILCSPTSSCTGALPSSPLLIPMQSSSIIYLFSFFLHSDTLLESAVYQSCIVFASLYGKTPYPRNGNLEEENYRFRGYTGGRFRTNCTPTPETVKKKRIITISGVCVGSMYSLYWENEEENPRIGKNIGRNYRFWDTRFYRINWQKRCTTDPRL